MRSKVWLLYPFITFIGLAIAGAAMPDESGPPEPKGYIIIEHEAVSQERLALLKTYSAVTRDLMDKHGGTFLAMEGEQIDPLEGNWNPEFVVILEFPTLTAARSFYNSDDYQTVLPDRLRAFPASKAILVSGRAMPVRGQ